MTADDLICDLSMWVKKRPKPKSESAFHNDILERLKKLNISFENKKQIPNSGAKGKSIPDMLVTSVRPQLLIEIKLNGGWKCVSEAAWQLYQSAELLRREGTETNQFAIFGTKFTDPILDKMLETLGIVSACVEV